MTWLVPRPDAIPAELRALPWVLWRAEPQGRAKPAKVPYQIADPGRRASSTDPTTWGPFADAVAAYGRLAARPAHPIRGPVVGIGAVLTAAAGITCLDLDRVLDAQGQLDPRAAGIVARCHSWTEISPSRTGLHVFVRGTVARAIKGGQVEVYADGRYICITGHQWPGTPATLAAQQPYLDGLVRIDTQETARLDAQETARPAPYSGPVVPPPDDLAGALLARLQAWGVPVARMKPWSDGYLVELVACPWAESHTAGAGGAAVIIHASGAFDFTCLHAHCARRTWRDFRAAMESR